MAQPSGLACANCGAQLAGPFCQLCGQSSDDKHRSIFQLAWEGIESLTHFDGRLRQTLPLLLLDPGRLARDHFEGRRQRHVPPFRLFFIALLTFIVTLESVVHGASGTIDRIKIVAPGHVANVVDGREKIGHRRTPAGEMQLYVVTVGGKSGHSESWVKSRLAIALANKDYYLTLFFTWAHRLAVLLLPILAGLLALAYIGKPKFYVYDHMIVAMQFLSFVFLVSAVGALVPAPFRTWTLAAVAIIVPVNLYQILRGAYGSHRYAAVYKTAFLSVSTVLLFGGLIIALVSLTLVEIAP